jgi:clan AA aspartic protease
MTATQTQPQGRQRHVGKVYADITISNRADEILARAGVIETEAIRRIHLTRILVDTGANTLCLPQSLVDQLGLPILKEAFASTAAGVRPVVVYDDARIALMGREGTFECLALPEDAEPLLGLLPLEGMGFEPDLQRETLRALPDGPTRETYITIY